MTLTGKLNSHLGSWKWIMQFENLWKIACKSIYLWASTESDEILGVFAWNDVGIGAKKNEFISCEMRKLLILMWH